MTASVMFLLLAAAVLLCLALVFMTVSQTAWVYRCSQAGTDFCVRPDALYGRPQHCSGVHAVELCGPGQGRMISAELVRQQAGKEVKESCTDRRERERCPGTDGNSRQPLLSSGNGGILTTNLHVPVSGVCAAV